MIVLDSGGLYAFLDPDDQHRRAARTVVDASPGPFLLSPFVLAEVDYLVTQRLGSAAALDLLDDVDVGAYTLVTFGDTDMTAAAHMARQYADLGIGVTDASVAVVAAHFRAIRPLRGDAAFRLLPADA